MICRDTMVYCQTPGMCSPHGGCTGKIPGLPDVKTGTPMPACKPPRSESGLRAVATVYTCRNPGQTALLWAWQPAPFGHGWIDVKAEPLVRLSDVEALRKDAERYRHMKSTWHDGSLIDRLVCNTLPEDWDATIDQELPK